MGTLLNELKNIYYKIRYERRDHIDTVVCGAFVSMPLLMFMLFLDITTIYLLKFVAFFAEKHYILFLISFTFVFALIVLFGIFFSFLSGEIVWKIIEFHIKGELKCGRLKKGDNVEP